MTGDFDWVACIGVEVLTRLVIFGGIFGLGWLAVRLAFGAVAGRKAAAWMAIYVAAYTQGAVSVHIRDQHARHDCPHGRPREATRAEEDWPCPTSRP